MRVLVVRQSIIYEKMDQVSVQFVILRLRFDSSNDVYLYPSESLTCLQIFSVVILKFYSNILYVSYFKEEKKKNRKQITTHLKLQSKHTETNAEGYKKCC